MNADARVSVVMAVYNGQRYLGEATESILGQTFRDFEFIAVDDGSTDDSLSLLRRYAQRDSRLRIISRPNTGLVGALNDGIDAARGELIARMDADDISLPERLARQVHFMDHHPHCVAAGSSYYVMSSRGEVIGEVAAEADSACISDKLLAGLCALAHPTTMIRADALRSVGGYRPEFAHAEDYDLWLRLDEVGRLGNLPETLFKYRWHYSSISQTHAATQSRHVVKANVEARRRRGIIDGDCDDALPQAALVRERSRPEFLRLCSTIALRHGAYRPALRFLVSAMVREPLSRDNWRLALRSLLGNRLADAMKTAVSSQQDAICR